MAQEFRINIVVDPSGAGRGIKRTDRQLGGLERRASNVGGALKRAFAFLAGGAVLAGSIRLLADFSQEMSTVRAITGATATEFEALTEEAKRLGTETRFSAAEAAEGMTFLARAGFDAGQTLGAVEGTLKLAQAGALGLGEAADIASNVLTGFRLEVDDTARVVDVLALAANSSNTTVSQLGQGLKFVAPVAAGLGIELETTTAAIGALSDAGLQASLAGTGLRRILSELESPSANTTKLLAGLGLTTDQVKVSQVGLVGALEALRNAGVDTGLALELFGDRGGPAFEVLATSIPKVKEMEEALRQAEGTADSIAAVMDDNLNGAILATKSAFQGLILELGDSGATGAFRSFFDTLTQGLRFLAGNVEATIRVLEGLAFVIGVTLAKRAIPSAIAGLRALAAAAFTNPFTALFGAITLAIGGLIAFRKEIADVEIRGMRLGDVLGAVWEAVVDRATFLFPLILDVATDVFNAVKDVVFGVFGAVAGAVQTSLQFIAGLFDSVFGEGALLGLFKTLGNVVIGLGQTVFDVFSLVARTLGRTFTALGEFDITAPIESAKRLGAALVDNVTLGFDEITDDVTENFSKDWLGELADTAALVAPILLDGFQGFEGGEAVKAFLDVRGDVNRKIAEREAERVARAFKAGFEATLKVLPIALGFALPAAAESTLPAPTIPPPDLPDFELSDQEAPSFTPDPQDLLTLEQVLDGLDEEARLLRLVRGERELAAEVLDIENQLREDGVQLTDAERTLLESRIQQVNALDDQARALDAIRGPQDEIARQLAALTALWDDNRIGAEEYSRALLDVELAQARLGTDSASGFQAGLLQSRKILEDYASVAERTVVNAFGAAEDALVEFAKTGQLNFSQLVDGLISDLARLLARQALFALINSFGGGGNLGSTIAGAFAEGGHAKRGSTYLVGEEGPELFVPRASGEVVPARETAALLAGAEAAGFPRTPEGIAQAVEALAGQEEPAPGALAGARGRGGVDPALRPGGGSGAPAGLQGDQEAAQRPLGGLVDERGARAIERVTAGAGFDRETAKAFEALGIPVAGARRAGGPVLGGQRYVAGEDGEELVREGGSPIATPARAGSLTQDGARAAALEGGRGNAAPIVNVQPPPSPAVNNFFVDDPSMVVAAIESHDGEQAILNIVRRNRDTL